MRSSGGAYDGGCQDEAIRIAVSVRLLLHDTRKSTTLLKHLDDIRLLSTCMDIRRMLDGSDPFYRGARAQLFNGMAVFGSAGCQPKLGEAPFQTYLPVTDW